MGDLEWSLTETIVILFALGRHCIKVAPSNQEHQQILRQALCLALLARMADQIPRSAPILGRVLRIERLNIEGVGERIQTKLKTWRWGRVASADRDSSTRDIRLNRPCTPRIDVPYRIAGVSCRQSYPRLLSGVAMGLYATSYRIGDLASEKEEYWLYC